MWHYFACEAFYLFYPLWPARYYELKGEMINANFAVRFEGLQ